MLIAQPPVKSLECDALGWGDCMKFEPRETSCDTDITAGHLYDYLTSVLLDHLESCPPTCLPNRKKWARMFSGSFTYGYDGKPLVYCQPTIKAAQAFTRRRIYESNLNAPGRPTATALELAISVAATKPTATESAKSEGREQVCIEASTDKDDRDNIEQVPAEDMASINITSS